MQDCCVQTQREDRCPLQKAMRRHQNPQGRRQPCGDPVGKCPRRERAWPQGSLFQTGDLKGASESGVPAGDLRWPVPSKSSAHANSLNKVGSPSTLTVGKSERSEVGVGGCSRGPGPWRQME